MPTELRVQWHQWLFLTSRWCTKRKTAGENGTLPWQRTSFSASSSSTRCCSSSLCCSSSCSFFILCSASCLRSSASQHNNHTNYNRPRSIELQLVHSGIYAFHMYMRSPSSTCCIWTSYEHCRWYNQTFLRSVSSDLWNASSCSCLIRPRASLASCQWYTVTIAPINHQHLRADM